MHDELLTTLAGVGVIAAACQWLAWRLKLPPLLFLLLAGLIAGPVTGWLAPEQLFGDLFFPLVSLSVAVILFEGSLTLRLDDIRDRADVVQRLLSTGVVVNWVVVALATRWLVGLPWGLAFLFGAIAIVSGPTVMIPLLRSIRPVAELSRILRWEGTLIEPIGALLSVLVFEAIASGQGEVALGHALLTFIRMLGSGLLLGTAAGYLLGKALQRYWIPEYLRDFVTLILVFAVFTAADLIQAESGLLAVAVMGIWIANTQSELVRDILGFKENLSLLLISGLFILLAATVQVEHLALLSWRTLALVLVLQLIARPLQVAVATAGSDLDWRRRTLLAWTAPRGIVAAAVAALFALRLGEQGYAEAGLLVPLTFAVIIATVVVQSATAGPMARRLGIAEPEPSGFLVIGANHVARAVAQPLRRRGYRVVLADAGWENIRAAREEDLETYYGDPVSKHADRHLSLIGLGRLLALSRRRELNVLAGLRYRSEFGAGDVYTLLTTPLHEKPLEPREATPQVGHIAFGSHASYSRLARWLGEGAQIREIPISRRLRLEELTADYGTPLLALYIVDVQGRVRVVSEQPMPTLQRGWTVIALVHPSTPRDETRATSHPPGQPSQGGAAAR